MTDRSPVSIAVDEIYTLRALCAHLVGTVDQMLDDRRLAAFRQNQLAEDRVLLLAAAQGDFESIQKVLDHKAALKYVGVDECLTNFQWHAQRGLT